ncbi:MAG: hypothetical protein U0791_20680 [Gemmataceae bacterium]
MNAIRIRKTIDSETLTIPELGPLIGRTVEIAIEESVPADAKKEFWDFASQFPETEEQFHSRQAVYRRWRNDPRFREFWFTIDHELKRDWADWQSRASAIEATAGLEDYDFDAVPAMDAADIEEQKREEWS